MPIRPSFGSWNKNLENLVDLFLQSATSIHLNKAVMISRNPGKCACDKDMIKTKVTKVEKGKITFESRDKRLVSVGKCACDCGPDFKCDTISQNPGNCTCGKKMMEVKAKVKK